MKLEGSDLHLKVGTPPIVRCKGDLKTLNRPPIEVEEMVRILIPMLDDRNRRIFEQEGGADFSYTVNVEGENGGIVHSPRQPNLSMKGRSPESLLEHVVRWHRDLAKNSGQKIRIWNTINIQPFRMTEGTVGDPNFKIWTIRELITQQSLFIEGRKLKHCVASYVSSCAKGQSSIWSMELEQSSVVEKRVTIEVNPGTCHIVQIRGKLNRHPNQQELNIIRRWTTEAKLVLRT